MGFGVRSHNASPTPSCLQPTQPARNTVATKTTGWRRTTSHLHSSGWDDCVWGWPGCSFSSPSSSWSLEPSSSPPPSSPSSTGTRGREGEGRAKLAPTPSSIRAASPSMAPSSPNISKNSCCTGPANYMGTLSPRKELEGVVHPRVNVKIINPLYFYAHHNYA